MLATGRFPYRASHAFTSGDQSAGSSGAIRGDLPINRTFVRAAPTQEAAAEVLGLPFSTYRRYLAKAVDEVTDPLWSVEIGAVRPASGQRLGTV